jgi:NAD(P)H-flavin reductase
LIVADLRVVARDQNVVALTGAAADVSPGRRFRFIAGGIGITPILPMLHKTDRPTRRCCPRSAAQR